MWLRVGLGLIKTTFTGWQAVHSKRVAVLPGGKQLHSMPRQLRLEEEEGDLHHFG